MAWIRKFAWKAGVVEFNSKPCGRCGGKGVYHFYAGGATQGTCYECDGNGWTMAYATQRKMGAFKEWVMETRPTFDAAQAELATGRFGRAYSVKPSAELAAR